MTDEELATGMNRVGGKSNLRAWYVLEALFERAIKDRAKKTKEQVKRLMEMFND